MIHTIIVKKDNIPGFRVNNEFGYKIGDQVGAIKLYDYMIVDIDGDHVTLTKVKEIEE